MPILHSRCWSQTVKLCTLYVCSLAVLGGSGTVISQHFFFTRPRRRSTQLVPLEDPSIDNKWQPSTSNPPRVHASDNNGSKSSGCDHCGITHDAFWVSGYWFIHKLWFTFYCLLVLNLGNNVLERPVGQIALPYIIFFWAESLSQVYRPSTDSSDSAWIST